MKRVWRRNRCLSRASLVAYQYWLHRFAAYCKAHSLDQRAELTQQGAERFARWWRSQGSPRRGQLRYTIAQSRHALRAWAFALSVLGEPLLPWAVPRTAPAFDRRFQAFADYLRDVRGNPASTIHKKIVQLTALHRYRRSRHVTGVTIRLSEIDAYIVACRRRFARTTVADIGSTIRGYLRFLHATGAMKADFSSSVMVPSVRTAERPHRTLPWDDVQRILRAVDRTTPAGRRDYALLLMMSVYGLGAGEVIALSLDAVDWRAMAIRVERPKTGAVFCLPLLPAIARALTDYLRHGRPAHTSTRHLFVTMRTPFKRLASSATVRHILHLAALRAGVTAPFLGTHALRHTHACRQLELGVPPKIIGDILGHRDPDSTSAYLRVTSDRLRELSLPVPV
ncbi:MAG: tyrosine-type recombinase/integrase [Rhodanobacteraceae bacterium]|nr:tyrosine-type recombinase/integrase [Rhodanobacteraceae bacterium]